MYIHMYNTHIYIMYTVLYELAQNTFPTSRGCGLRFHPLDGAGLLHGQPAGIEREARGRSGSLTFKGF